METVRSVEPRAERVKLSDHLELRVLVWQPDEDPQDGLSAADRLEVPKFLLVHGLASNCRTWDGVARRLAAAGHLAVAVDLRGHGLSDKPDEGYDFATISEDLAGLIALRGLSRPIVAGQSWGASVVLDLAVRHPELVRGIVTVDGALNDLRGGFPDFDACWERLAPPLLVGRPLLEIEAYFRRAHADWPAEGIAGSLGNFEILPDGTIAPWLSRDNHKRILRAMWDQSAAELWRELRVPALIVPVESPDAAWTEAKRAGAIAAYSAMSHSGTPVRLQWFSGDHDVHAQHPAELSAAMLEAARTGLFGGVRTV